MKGKIYRMIKKWWVIALVFTLAFSLTSCSSKKKNLPTDPLSQVTHNDCKGAIGDFDVYLAPSKNDPDLFELFILPYNIPSPGDAANVTIANQSNGFKNLVSPAILNIESTIFAGFLTRLDVENYSYLALWSYNPYDPTPFPEARPEKATYCALPLPYEGNGFTQN